MADGVGIALEFAALEQGAATARTAAEAAKQMAAQMDVRIDPAAYGTLPTGVELAQALVQARAAIVAVATAAQQECEELSARAEAVSAMGQGLVADTSAVARRPVGPG